MRCKSLVLAVGKSQLLPQPLGIFRHRDGEGAEPAHSVRLNSDRRLDLGHVLEASQITHATEHTEQASPHRSLKSASAPRAARQTSFIISMRTRSRDS